MEKLVQLITNLSVDTNLLSLDHIQEVLINAKRNHKSKENNVEQWNNISEMLWSHLQNGLGKIDDQLLCATCFFTVITLTDKQALYLNKMKLIIDKEISLGSEDIKDNTDSLQAASLMYGMYQSAFLTQNFGNDKSIVEDVCRSTFTLLTIMGYEYSKFTFIAFKTMNSFKKVCGTDLEEVIFNKEYRVKLLNLINHNWENPITGVRDLNKGMFKQLISILDKHTYQSVIEEINGFYWNKAKYLMLSEVAESYKGDIANLIFKNNWIVGLINSLHKPGLVSAGADMYYAILNKIHSLETWCNVFLQKIIKALTGPPSKVIENFSNYWCLITLQKFPSLMEILIDELEKFENTERILYSILFIMKQGNKIRILNKNWHSSENFTKTEIIVQSAIEHCNTRIRTLAFDIICLSQGKIMPSKTEYALVLEYLQYNVNSDCAVLRLNMLSSFNTFLIQVHILFRNMKDNQNNETEGLIEFCKKLQGFVVSSLSLDGNYQRKITVVKVINTIIDCFSQIPRKRKDQTRSTNMALIHFLRNKECWMLHDESFVLKLISLLKDPSDDIRDNVVNLLLNHYSSELRKTEFMNSLVEDASHSMKSKFFFEISCGQSILKLIVNLLLTEKHNEAIFKTVDDVFNYGYNNLSTEYTLKRDILKSIEDGKQLHSFISILQVVLDSCIVNSYELHISEAAMIGLLDILHGITNQFPWEQENSTSSDFSKVNEMVEDIIAKSEYYNPINGKDETKISGLHQIVLNCLWLNVKAACDLASLLLKYHKDDVDKCCKCLTLITHVLETSRHKGAIEAAGAALGRGIQHLTRLPEDSKVSNLPQTLLKTKLDILIREASKMASITRRGAGLSIMVHRIVSSDMRKGKPLFHYFMKTLLQTCKNTEDITKYEANVENQMDLPKAIFIHFLTRIVIDSSLASDMMFYSAELAELAFSNLTSPHWQIRNAALQLYGALIPRFIGQKKASGTDDETIATVACDELRTHSSQLWKFIVQQLKNDNHTDTINSHSNLVPILNLLASSAKRYNFSYDNKEQETSDLELLKSLIKILDSPIHTVRRLTARCIFNIFPFKNIYESFMNVDLLSENFIHGALMLLKLCHKYYSQHKCEDPLKSLQRKFSSALNSKKHSYWSREVYESTYSNNDMDVNNLFEKVDENVNTPGIFVWANTCIKSCILQSEWDTISDILCIVLKRKDYETYCEYLLCKLESDSCIPDTALKQIATILLSFINKYKSSIIWKILYVISLKTVLKNVDVKGLLSDLGDKEISYKLRYAIPFAARLTSNTVSGSQEKLVNAICKMSDFETADVDMRYIAALANNEMANSFDKLSDSVKVASIKAAIILLQDEDEDVRNISVQYYKIIGKLDTPVHANICLNQILDYSFLRTIFCEPQKCISIISQDLLELVSNNSQKDEYNPFANDSKNIYLEVEVLKQSLQNLMHN